MRTIKFQSYLEGELRDPELAAEFLTASYEEGSAESFLNALRQVVEVLGGMGKLSKTSKLGRQNLYRMLSEDGNPTLRSLDKLLEQAGLRLAFLPRKRA